MEKYFGNYDKQGNPISFEEYLHIRNTEGVTVIKTIVGDIEVSTVWLGTDHNFGAGDEIAIFETMFFGLEQNSGDWDYCERYATIEQALKGHEASVRFASKHNNKAIWNN